MTPLERVLEAVDQIVATFDDDELGYHRVGGVLEAIVSHYPDAVDELERYAQRRITGVVR